MVSRTQQETLERALESMPVVALLGPRQVGKTTLALQIADLTKKPTTYLDLESDADFNKLTDAEAYLKRFAGELLIIDEVQRKPDLFHVIRGIVDLRKRNGERSGHFLLLGSASRDLLQQSSETLAGRIRYLELSPFTAQEVIPLTGTMAEIERLWLRGGFPDSYLTKNDQESWNWRTDFSSTYMERDLPSLGVGISPTKLKRFWKMLAHYHGNQVNMSELARSLELSQTTIKNYLDTLTDFYMVRQLPPWFGNVKKRLVKSPKIYIRDSGILHNLLGLSKIENLYSHPSLGASWEGFVIENILSLIDNRWQVSYYRTATQVEVDLVLNTPDGEVWAVEVKLSSAPKLGNGFHIACNDIRATSKWVVNPYADNYPLTNGVEVVGLMGFLRKIRDKCI